MTRILAFTTNHMAAYAWIGTPVTAYASVDRQMGALEGWSLQAARSGGPLPIILSLSSQGSRIHTRSHGRQEERAHGRRVDGSRQGAGGGGAPGWRRRAGGGGRGFPPRWVGGMMQRGSEAPGEGEAAAATRAADARASFGGDGVHRALDILSIPR